MSAIELQVMDDMFNKLKKLDMAGAKEVDIKIAIYWLDKYIEAALQLSLALQRNLHE